MCTLDCTYCFKNSKNRNPNQAIFTASYIIKEEDPTLSYIYIYIYEYYEYIFAKALHHASSIRLKATHLHSVSVEFRTCAFNAIWCSIHIAFCDFIVGPSTISSMQIWNYIYTYVSHIMSLKVLSLLRKIKAYYDGKDHHTVLPLFRMYDGLWCSVQLFRGIRRCSFNLMTCMNSQSCGADLSQPSGKLIVVPCVFLPRCQVSKSSILSPGGYQYWKTSLTEE